MDLMRRVTEDRQNFQGRCILRHPWTGDATCEAADAYFDGLAARIEHDAQTLARFARSEIKEIRDKMKTAGQDASFRPASKPWWDKMWKGR